MFSWVVDLISPFGSALTAQKQTDSPSLQSYIHNRKLHGKALIGTSPVVESMRINERFNSGFIHDVVKTENGRVLRSMYLSHQIPGLMRTHAEEVLCPRSAGETMHASYLWNNCRIFGDCSVPVVYLDDHWMILNGGEKSARR